MRRLLRHLTGPRPHHRRDWRRLWRFCRCGWRWRCPGSVELVPVPYQPPPPLPLTEVERAEIRALSTVPTAVTPDTPPPPPPARVRAGNRRPGWDPSPRSQLANGRTGALTPARRYRARHGERV